MNVVKKSHHQISEKVGQPIFIDLSSVKIPEDLEAELPRKPFWRISVDEKMQMNRNGRTYLRNFRPMERTWNKG
jgi:hypothetical protein